MVRFYDDKYVLQIELRNRGESCERELLEHFMNDYDEVTNDYYVESIFWVLQGAEDWKHNRSVYYDEEGNPDEREMIVKIWRWEA